MDDHETQREHDQLEMTSAEFIGAFGVGQIGGSEILSYFNACEATVKWVRCLDQSNQKVWALLAKPASTALTAGFGLMYEILVLCSSHKEFQPRLLESRREVASLLAPGRLQDDLTIVVCDDPHLAEKLRRHDTVGHMYLGVSSAEVSESMRSGHPSERFRRLLQDKLYARDCFDRTGPVQGADFFGRTPLLNEIVFQLERGSHVGLFGLRKVGKTSIIKNIQTAQAELAPWASFIHIDLLATLPANRTSQYLLFQISNALLRNLGPKTLHELGARNFQKWSRFDEITSEKKFEREFESDITTVLQSFSKTGRRLVVILDEIEQLFPINEVRTGFAGYENFLAFLRGLSQTIGSLSVMVVGVNPHISEAQLLGTRQNPMFGFFTTQYVPPMPEDEMRQMIKFLGRASGATFDHESIATIYALTGGHPFLARRYCSLLIKDKQRPAHIKKMDVDNKKDEFVRQNVNHFAEMVSVVRESFPEEFLILHKIANGPNDIPVETINRQALAHLEGYQLVEAKSGAIRLQNELLREWLTGLASPRAQSMDARKRAITDEVPSDRLKQEIERLETALRHAVRAKLNERWAGKARSRIQSAIGEEAMRGAQERLEKSIRKYHPESSVDHAEILDYLYTGELFQIVCGNEWQIFKDIFIEKGEVERASRIIVPARNELQHFRPIPAKDSLRVFVAIQDIMERIDANEDRRRVTT